MNIKITHNWLSEFLDTNADPYEIQKYLSLCGPSIERVEKIGNDYVYDIEITSNRVDNASVFGIAQECLAILPQFEKRAELRYNPLDKYRFSLFKPQKKNVLNIKISQPDLCSRFTAVVLDITLKDSPEFIKNRLELVGIKSINNVVDISNYLMVALGQPTHMFDYDKIGKQTMIMRESKKGEKIVTLDEKELELPGGDIVIEDGDKKLIDLCGIMGGLNSSITPSTKRIVFFVQTYNKYKIRHTSMTTGQRTMAATYFEKGLDEERVENALVYGIELLKQFADTKIGSELYDIYRHPKEKKTIDLSLEEADKTIGVTIDYKTATRILESLGFSIQNPKQNILQLVVPSYRNADISIKEDVIEEIARVYGYHNIPEQIQSASAVKQPQEIEQLFLFQTKIKYFLKHLGLHESMNYSMISKELIEQSDLSMDHHLKLQNSISEDITYLRVSLLPSLIKNIKENEGRREELKFFEIAKVYLPRINDLPEETYRLGIAVNTNFSDLKGILEALCREYHIRSIRMEPIADTSLFSKNTQLGIFSGSKTRMGTFGKLNQKITTNFGLKNNMYLAEIDFHSFIKECRLLPQYQQINPYAVVKLDLTLTLDKKIFFENIRTLSYKTSPYLERLEVLGIYENKLNLRFYFTSRERNLTEEEAKTELEKIKKRIQNTEDRI